MGAYYVFTTACYATSVSRYATTLMADGVLAGASGWRQVDEGRAGGIKKIPAKSPKRTLPGKHPSGR